jgi:hypothetical protein
MNPSEIIPAFKQRTLDLDCVHMILSQTTENAPVTYSGKGYIRQSNDDRLSFKIYVSETTNTDKYHDLKEMLENQPGKLFQPNEYYNLSVVTTDGLSWSADRILRSADWGATDPNPIVTGYITVLATSWPMPDAAHSLSLHFFDDADLPYIVDRAKFAAVNCDVAVSKSDSGFVVEASAGDALPPDFHMRIEEAFRFLLARSVAWRVSINQAGDQQHFQLASATPQAPNTKLGRPINHGYVEASWKLFSKYLEYVVANTPSSSRNRCSYYLHNACEMSAGSLDAWAVGVSVAVEGIANLLNSETLSEEVKTRRIEERKRLRNLRRTVIEHISSHPFFKDLVGRLSGVLGMMQNEGGPQNRLKPLVESGHLDPAYIDAWSKLRNKHVHPTNRDLQDMTNATEYNQTTLDMINKTTVLMYKIIFQVIGYEGKFTDYGNVGYPLKDYPPVKLV